MLYKIKVDGREYAVEKFTLGDLRVSRRVFGLSDLEAAEASGDPEYLAFIVYVAFRAAQPNASESDILAQVDALDITTLEIDAEDEAVEVPLDAADGDEASAKRGKSAKPRKRTGSQS